MNSRLEKAHSLNKVISNAGTLDLAQPAYPAAETPSSLEDFYKSAKAPNLKCVDISLLGGLYVCHVALAQFRGQGADQNGSRGKVVLAGSEA